MYVCIHVCMCMHVCMYACLYVCMYLCMYAYIIYDMCVCVLYMQIYVAPCGSDKMVVISYQQDGIYIYSIKVASYIATKMANIWVCYQDGIISYEQDGIYVCSE